MDQGLGWLSCVDGWPRSHGLTFRRVPRVSLLNVGVGAAHTLLVNRLCTLPVPDAQVREESLSRTACQPRHRSCLGQDRFFRDMRGQLALTACRTPSFSLFGIGDIVFDPTSCASLVSQPTTLETQSGFIDQLFGMVCRTVYLVIATPGACRHAPVTGLIWEGELLRDAAYSIGNRHIPSATDSRSAR
jgi:hypothetical protein